MKESTLIVHNVRALQVRRNSEIMILYLKLVKILPTSMYPLYHHTFIGLQPRVVKHPGDDNLNMKIPGCFSVATNVYHLAFIHQHFIQHKACVSITIHPASCTKYFYNVICKYMKHKSCMSRVAYKIYSISVMVIDLYNVI